MELKIGDRVSTPSYGEGVIIAIAYNGNGTKYSQWSFLVKHDVAANIHHKGNHSTSIGNNSSEKDSWYYYSSMISLVQNPEVLPKIFN